MEERRKEVRSYLDTHIHPLLKPMIEDIVRKRPTNVFGFIIEYSRRMLGESLHADQRDAVHSEEEDPSLEAQQEFQRKLDEKKSKKQKKISRQAISAECFGIFNKKADFVPTLIEKDVATRHAIQALIQKSILFDSLNQNDLRIVIDAMTIRNAAEGEAIITEGEAGDTLYVIGSGEYACSKLIQGSDTFLKTYKAGECFGELALMYNAPRAASIRCTVPGQLYGLDRLTFVNIVQTTAQKKRAHYQQVLSKVEILSDMDAFEKDQVCDNLKEEEFSAGQYVIRQGESGDKFYMVAEGQLAAEKAESDGQVRKVLDYREGDYFGEIALIKDTVRQASVKAVTHCRVVSIERDAFKRLLGSMEDILQRNMHKYSKFLQA